MLFGGVSGVIQFDSGYRSYRSTTYASWVGMNTKQSIAIALQTCFRRGCLDDEGVGTALESERMFINPITKTRS